MRADTTIAEAAQLMWERDCGILPVVDDGELVGESNGWRGFPLRD